MNPNSRAAIAYRNIARRILGDSVPLMQLEDRSGMFIKMKKVFRDRMKVKCCTSLKKIDPLIVFLLLAFMVISTLLLYSATLNDSMFTFDTKKLAIVYSISIVAFFLTAAFDYRVLIKTSYYLYGIGILLLVAVYFFGSKINAPAVGSKDCRSDSTFNRSNLSKLF